MSAEPKVVLVSGGASGLGAAVVEAARKEGWSPLVLDRRPAEVATPHEVVNVADWSAVRDAVCRMGVAAGRIDGVVTAAGIDRCGPLDAVDAQEWERVVSVNLVGTANVVRAALPYLRRSNGRVVTVASTLGLRPASDATAYCASKFGVVGFTRALALELKGEVGVTMLVPGGMQTAFFDDRDEAYRPAPEAQLNPPENVASAVIFALSQPENCEIREMVVTPSTEPSWP